MIPGITASTRRGAPEPPGSTIGEPLGGGFYAGDIEIDGQWYKLIVADKEADITGANSRWKTTTTGTPNTEHLTDGIANTNAMVAAGISLHPAANHCVNYEGGGYTDWYMPSLGEMQVISQNLRFDHPNCPPDFQVGGPQAFEDAFYWTSTQYSSTSGWVKGVIGGQGYDSKTLTNRRVRPIRRIPFNP